MKKYVPDIIAICVVIDIVSIFFLRLFWPVSQLIVTPDFGRSDAWHFSFGQKYALWQALREHRLPLWSKDIGDGFPLLSEGQIGTYYLPNLLLFSLPDPVAAYNLALIVAIVTFALGMYWCCRLLKYSPFASVIGALTLAFSGVSILHLVHMALLQGLSMLPVLFSLTILISRYSSFMWVGFFAIAASQQLFAGFPQASFLTMILCIFFIIWNAWSTRNTRGVFRFLSALVLFLGISGAQLLPSWEFLRQTTNPRGFSADSASLYSFPLKHIRTFFTPYALGNPKDGTYPPFYEFDGSIFWENNGYMGILPLVFIIIALWRKKIPGREKFLAGTAGLALLMAWGKYSPLYFLYSFWPLTLFRVPSRFIWLIDFTLILLAMGGLSRMLATSKNRTFTTLVAVSSIGNILLLMYTWWSYHLLAPAAVWLEAPQSATDISGRIYTIGSGPGHNDYFIAKGWTKEEPYRFLREGMDPESNLIWGVSQHDVLSGRALRRSGLSDSLLTKSMTVSQTTATFSAQTRKYLNMFSIANVLTWVPLDNHNLDLKRTIEQGNLTLRIFENPSTVPRLHVVHELTQASTLSQAYMVMQNQSFQPDKTVLLESHAVETSDRLEKMLTPGKTAPESTEAELSILRDDHEHIVVNIRNNPREGLLVIADTFYPGWVARVDGAITPIYAANLSQRAIYVPDGSHTVTLDYFPQSVLRGIYLSVLSLTLTILGVVAQIVVLKLRTVKTTPGHASSLWRNPAR